MSGDRDGRLGDSSERKHRRDRSDERDRVRSASAGTSRRRTKPATPVGPPSMHRRRLLASLSAGAIGGLAGCSSRGYDGSGAAGPPRLSVDGRWVLDPDGNVVVLRGVSAVDPVWGVEHADERGKGYWETLELATSASAGWHARVIRIPVEPASIDAVGIDAVVEEHLDRAVELGAERDAYVLLDFQAVERYDTHSIDRRLRAFWNRVAPRYADESHVLYELFGAPTEPGGGGLESWRTWRETASPWVSLVREHAPETPVVVGSPAWSSLTAHAAAEPFAHDDLLYAAHVYPSFSPRTWEERFGDPAFDVPVFVTEWGYENVAPGGSSDHVIGTTGEWGEPFREWVDARENVHWCANAFDSRRQPSMFDDDWTSLGGEDHMGQLVRDWLEVRRSDHRPGGSTLIPSDDGNRPAAPLSVAVVEVGETAATLEWELAEETDAVVQVRLAIDEGEALLLRGTERSRQLLGLDPDREYDVTVTAVDEHGRASRPTTVSFRTLEPGDPEATIARTRVDPIGAEVWDVAEAHAIELLPWADGSFDVAGEWRALWDEDALYVRADVFEPADADWDSAVELYLDLDNSQESSYDGVDDVQLYSERGADWVYGGTHSAPVADRVEAVTTETDAGWRTELTIPWASYDADPVLGHRFGMDVHVLVTREDAPIGKVVWYDTADDAWQDPRRLATVELGR